MKSKDVRVCNELSFQFIEFPSEWGASWANREFPGCAVSNLLSSPASGETELGSNSSTRRSCFQFIEFPSEWGEMLWVQSRFQDTPFPIY